MKRLLLSALMVFLGSPSYAQSTLFSNSTTGNVGIGTTNPQSTLSVNGGVAIGSNYAGSNAAATNNLIVQGNMGIGTSTPANSLDVDSGGGIHIGSGTPTSTSNALYAVGSTLQWNGAPVATQSPYDVYADPNTQLLLHMENNANDSSIFGYTMTNSGVTFSNSVYKLGSYAAYFNGTSSSGDYLVTTANLEPTTNMTFDFFVYFSGNVPYKGSNTNYEENLFNFSSGPTTGQINVTSGTTSSVPNAISVQWGSGTSAIVGAPYSFSLNTWYHLALEVIGSKCYVWINGVQVASASSNIATPSSAPLYIGYIPTSGYNDYFLGYIDEFRVSNAVRYQPGVSFTPPSAPYNPGPIQ